MRTERLTRLAAGLLIGGCGLFSGGCATKAGTGALAGGAIGAGVGGLVGAATGNTGAGAAIGGALGAGTGGIIGASEDSKDETRREVRQATAAQAQAHQARLGIQEVAEMVRAGHSDEIIINQLRSSGSTFHLTSGDLNYLKSSGVPDRVIIEMQNLRAAAPVIVSPRPRTVVVHEQPTPVYVYERPPPPPVVFVHPRPPRPQPVFVGGVIVR